MSLTTQNKWVEQRCQSRAEGEENQCRLNQ